jgi:hypothetical protein
MRPSYVVDFTRNGHEGDLFLGIYG